MKILIIKFRNIGDVLLTTPILPNLKKHFPNASIDIAVNKGTEAVVCHHPDICETLIYDRERVKSLPLFRRLIEELKFAKEIRQRNYDIVINLTEGDRGAQLALISQAKIRVGYPPPKATWLKKAYTHLMPPQGMRHTIEANLDALRTLKVPIQSKHVHMHIPEQCRKTVEGLLRRYGLMKRGYIHFHPVSRWLFKCIDDRTAARIIDFCQQELGIPVVMTAAPAMNERKKLDNIKSHCQSEPIDLGGRLTLEETAAIADSAKLFVGVDTAVMHIAAAVDTPVVAFFGPSGAFHWGPWDNACKESGYKNRNGMQRMGKHKVLALDWTCIPCGQDGCEGTKISDCLVQMPVSMILKEIEESLNDQHS